MQELKVASGESLRERGANDHGLPTSRVLFRLQFLDAVFGDFEYSFTIRKIWAADQASDSHRPPSRFPEVYTGVTRVSNHMPSYWMNSVSKEDVRLGHDLVSDDGDSVEGTGEADELMHVLVQSLLTKGQGLPPHILAAKVRGQAVNDYQADVVFLYDFIRVFKEENLVVTCISVCNNDIPCDFRRVKVDMVRHLNETLCAECVFGVNV
jgi:hypothetical protein